MATQQGRGLNRQQLMAELDHAVRSPLSSIFNRTDLILAGLEGDISEDVQRDVEIIATEAQRLYETLERLLQLTQVEVFPPERQPINIRLAVEEAVRKVQSQVEHEGRQLVVSVSDALPTVLAHALSIQQLVQLLLLVTIRGSTDAVVRLQVSIDTSAIAVHIGAGEVSANEDKVTIANLSREFVEGSISVDLLLGSLLAEQNGGELWATHGSEDHTILHFTIPIFAQ